MSCEIPDIPSNMRRLYRRLNRWQSAHTGRLPIPERLWVAAAELAREHGIYPTAKALHLEYGKLKRRAEAGGVVKRRRVKAPAVVPGGARPTAPPTFVELMAPRFPGAAVEPEGSRGRMRIELKGVATAELVALSRALWDSGA
jgi:hypothetical protein